MERKKLVLSIGRQYGSDGSEIGRRLAELLKLDFYDKNILRMTSDQSGIKESYFHLADEKAGSRLLYKIMGSMAPEVKTPSFGSDLISADNLFRFQSEVMKKLAGEQSFVIMGRCANYVLDGFTGLERLFIYADLETRTARITAKDLYDPGDVKKHIKRIDKERRDYYRYYTGKEWENPENYDLMMNSTRMTIDEGTSMLLNYLKVKGYDV